MSKRNARLRERPRRVDVRYGLACLAVAASVGTARTALAQGSMQPFLGVRMEAASAGVRVTSVLPGSGAHGGGLQAGDQLVAVAGAPVRSPEDVSAAVSRARVGDHIPLEVLRRESRLDLSALVGPRPAPGEAIRALVGAPAPQVHLPELGRGGTVDLAAMRGRVVLLYFWSVHCGACRLALPTLEHLERSLGTRGLSVVAVTDDTEAELRTVVSRSPVAYALAHDVGAKAGASYWIDAVPSFFVVDRTGNVVHASEGWDPGRAASLEASIRQALGHGAP